MTLRRISALRPYGRQALLFRQSLQPLPAISRSQLSVAAAASDPAPLQGAGGGGRKCPGNPYALARVFGMSPSDSPSRIAGCRWLFRDHSAASGTATFSLNPLSVSLLRPAIEKLYSLVQKLWTFGLSCGTRRKSKKQFRARFILHERPQSLTRRSIPDAPAALRRNQPSSRNAAAATRPAPPKFRLSA